MHSHSQTETPAVVSTTERTSKLILHWADHLKGHEDELDQLMQSAHLPNEQLKDQLGVAKSKMQEATLLLIAVAEALSGSAPSE
ncbi:hypothetical protein [Pseudovibrio sp. POLY-S9]|uniref:hypothetical protein n=1 Tax=Pseudovibrio sp. POLY-S9 TaxID=1576596 RepID=UPI00070DE138|nr:hypothetical protein [Pseudovibrio sp. POLY-S9]